MSDQPEKPLFSDVVSFYVKLRDEKDELDRLHKEKVAKYSAKLEELDAYLLAELSAMGMESVRTDHGTAYVSRKERFNCTSWPELIPWLIQNNQVELLQKRLSETNLKQYIQQNSGALPPAIQSTVVREVNVRRT